MKQYEDREAEFIDSFLKRLTTLAVVFAVIFLVIMVSFGFGVSFL